MDRWNGKMTVRLQPGHMFILTLPPPPAGRSVTRLMPCPKDVTHAAEATVSVVEKARKAVADRAEGFQKGLCENKKDRRNLDVQTPSTHCKSILPWCTLAAPDPSCRLRNCTSPQRRAPAVVAQQYARSPRGFHHCVSPSLRGCRRKPGGARIVAEQQARTCLAPQAAQSHELEASLRANGTA